MAAAVARARAINPDLLLEVEVESMEELDQAINASVDRVLLDNFNLAMLKDAAAFSADAYNRHRIEPRIFAPGAYLEWFYACPKA